MQNHLNIVKNEVKCHVPNRFHRLLHQPVGRKMKVMKNKCKHIFHKFSTTGKLKRLLHLWKWLFSCFGTTKFLKYEIVSPKAYNWSYLFMYFITRSNFSKSFSSIRSVQYFTTCRMSSSMGSVKSGHVRLLNASFKKVTSATKL